MIVVNLLFSYSVGIKGTCSPSSHFFTVAVEACADDTRGQMCFICMDGDSEEGLVRGCACRGAAGFAHVSCLAEQAKILVAEAEEKNLGVKAVNERWARWYTCRLCEQRYHGVVMCALGWACWKTYLGRPETDGPRQSAMNLLGNGLSDARRDEDALFVKEAELSMMRRLGASECNILVVQGNLASTYEALGRREEALCLRHDVYSETLKLEGEESDDALREANNYAASFMHAKRFEEAKSLLIKTMPVARRVLGTGGYFTLKMRWLYAMALYMDAGATLDDLREAVTTLEDTVRVARRVLGGAHPTTGGIETSFQKARAALRARETQSPARSA